MSFTPGFTNVFGNTPISSAYPTYASYTISSETPDQTIKLGWSTTFQNVPNVVANIMDINVTASTEGTLQLPDATQASIGTAFVINNYSASQSVNVVNASGTLVCELQVQTPDEANASSVLIYLYDNTSIEGAWRYINYGGIAGGFNPSLVAGQGLKPSSINSEQLMVNFLVQEFDTNLTLNAQERALVLVFKGTLPATVTLPPPAAVSLDIGNGYFVTILNNYKPNTSSAPTLTIATPFGDATFNGQGTTYSMPFGAEVTFYCDGAGWWTFRGNKGGSDVATFPDGSVTAPGIAFTNQTGTGFYRYTSPATGHQVIGVSVNGTQQAYINSDGGLYARNYLITTQVAANTFEVSSSPNPPQNQAFLSVFGSALNGWYLTAPTDGFYFGWGSPTPSTPKANVTIGKAITAPAANTYVSGDTSGLQAQNVVAINGLYAGSTASGAAGKLYINGMPLNLYLRASGF